MIRASPVVQAGCAGSAQPRCRVAVQGAPARTSLVTHVLPLSDTVAQARSRTSLVHSRTYRRWSGNASPTRRAVGIVCAQSNLNTNTLEASEGAEQKDDALMLEMLRIRDLEEEDNTNYVWSGDDGDERAPSNLLTKVVKLRSVFDEAPIWFVLASAALAMWAEAYVPGFHALGERLGLDAFSVLGAALFLCLGLKTNQAAERWVQGAKEWKVIEEETVIFVQGLHVIEDRAIQARLARLAIAHAYALKAELREDDDEDAYEVISTLLCDDTEVERLMATGDAASAIMQEVRLTVREAFAHLPRDLALDLELGLYEPLSTAQRSAGVCRQIRDVPPPVAYDVQLRIALFFWLSTLPVPLSASLPAGTTLLVVGCIAWVILGIELAGAEIEHPFGEDFTDLPLTVFCKAIRTRVANSLLYMWGR